MTRVKGGPRGHRAHKKIIDLAKGYRGTRNRLFKRANEAVIRATEHAFSGRKQRRRDLRRLWIARINGALTSLDGVANSASKLKYSRFIKSLKDLNIDLNRKMLSEMAINDAKGFEIIVEKVKSLNVKE